jgi:GNAT superfamily N-acetyltransferase
VSVRLATAADVPAILAMVEAFVRESDYGMTFDSERSADHLAVLLDHPEVAVFMDDERPAAMIVAIQHAWCVQPECYVEKLFLMPEARGTGVARSLVAAAVEFARQHNCSHIFATATAGMGDIVGRLYTNLFAKFGFQGCGPVLCRSM